MQPPVLLTTPNMVFQTLHVMNLNYSALVKPHYPQAVLNSHDCKHRAIDFNTFQTKASLDSTAFT